VQAPRRVWLLNKYFAMIVAVLNSFDQQIAGRPVCRTPLSTIADLIFLRIHGLPAVIAIDKHVGENSFAKLDLWAVTCFEIPLAIAVEP
jgi:hypothetical protein